MTTKNYTSLYQIKNYLVNTIAPKYLSTDEMNMASTGLFGYITEALATLGEDGLNATSIVFKECFANAAENPESLYLMAAIYQLSELFATPATMPFILLLSEDDVINGGTDSSGISTFHIDANTKYSIDDKNFTTEYDILISSKTSSKGYVHSVTYVEDHTNDIATSTTKYIQSKVIKYSGKNYIAMLLNLRQMTMTEFSETIIGNDKINVCSFDFDLGTSVQIAGFEAYYTPPNSTVETQLTKKLQNTTKLTTPFCYYTMPSEGVLRIEFANDDRYFIPDFNSVLRVDVYTTDGASGNFSKYTGSNINITPVSTKYSEDNALIMIGQVEEASTGGLDKKTTDELRDAVITAQATVNAYNTTSDLALYFKKMANAGNTRISFMKRRDDALIRLFNAFVLLTDSNNVAIPTNTCDLVIEESDIDDTYTDTSRSVIKAGKIFKASSTFSGYLGIDKTTKMTDDLDSLEDSHVYTNPFLTIMSSSPVSVGFYLNSVDTSYQLEAGAVNSSSFVQFMASGLSVSRNALLGENDYVFTMKLLPTSSSIADCVTEIKSDTLVKSTDKTFTASSGTKYIDNQLIKIVFMFTDSGTETCYKELTMYDYDGTYYYFKMAITTNDYVSTNTKLDLVNSVYDLLKGTLCSEKFVPCNNITANIYTFYKYTTDGTNISHDYEKYNIATGYTLTNMYTTSSYPIDLVVPLNSINGYLYYNSYLDANKVTQYNYMISSVPVVKANYVKNLTRFTTFLSLFNTIYNYLNDEIDLLTNNFDIDIKFFNTFGPSKNYVVGDNSVALDKTNITLKFEVKSYYNTDTDVLMTDIKNYILDYIRNDFDSNGNNAVYISNLMRKLEVDFSTKIEYIIYRGINSYDLSVQKLEPKITDDNLSTYYSSMVSYVPEYINVAYNISGTAITPQIEITML